MAATARKWSDKMLAAKSCSDRQARPAAPSGTAAPDVPEGAEPATGRLCGGKSDTESEGASEPPRCSARPRSGYLARANTVAVLRRPSPGPWCPGPWRNAGLLEMRIARTFGKRAVALMASAAGRLTAAVPASAVDTFPFFDGTPPADMPSASRMVPSFDAVSPADRLSSVVGVVLRECAMIPAAIPTAIPRPARALRCHPAPGGGLGSGSASWPARRRPSHHRSSHHRAAPGPNPSPRGLPRAVFPLMEP